MQIEVGRVVIPPGSTIGFAVGHPVDSKDVVVFAGDHRPMKALGEALEEGALIVADVPDEMIVLRIADPDRN